MDNPKNINTKICHFCSQNIKSVDFKNTDLLRRFISAQAKIMPRKRSGLCAAHQRALARAIKQARFMALLPISGR